MNEESLEVTPAGKIGRFQIIRLAGEFDLNEVRNFEAKIDEILADNKAHVVLDLNELEYLDSSGIGCLVRLYRDTVERADGKFVIYRPKDFIKELFEVSNLTKFLAIVESQEALERTCQG